MDLSFNKFVTIKDKNLANLSREQDSKDIEQVDVLNNSFKANLIYMSAIMWDHSNKYKCWSFSELKA